MAGKKRQADGAAKRRERKMKTRVALAAWDDRIDAINRELAREQVRRELAVWVMAVRVQFERLHKSVQEVYFASRKEDSLLHGLVSETRLRRIYAEMENIDGDLPLLTVAPALPDVVGVARGYAEH